MKTFDTAALAIDFALLYPNCQIVTTAKTLGQANLIIDEKINKIFTSRGNKWSSPVLCQLREDGWIKFSVNKDTGGKVVEFGNGSRIFAMPCIESARGILILNISYYLNTYLKGTNNNEEMGRMERTIFN